MSKKTITTGLAVVILLQIVVLGSEYLGAIYPLWTGEEIKLKTTPVDPRSLFRGNYARLRYDISTIEWKDLRGKKGPRRGEVVYVKLNPTADGLYVFGGVSLEKPESGLFIRGRVQRKHSRRRNVMYDIRYGIEAYFAPKEKALALEKDLWGGGVAIVMIAGNGRATLKEVITNRNNVS